VHRLGVANPPVCATVAIPDFDSDGVARVTETSTPRSPAEAMAEAARFLAEPPPLSDGVLLLGSVGWEPLELVTGISWFSIPRGAWVFGKGENATVTTAHQRAVEAAERQLADQCTAAGGHGVVGVHLERKTTRHHVSVELVGTAVRPIGADALGSRPFTSDLSARDFVVLSKSGWRPVALCVGLSFVFVSRRRRGGGVRNPSGNFELENYTKSLYNAREQAMERMQSAALAVGATGIIGTTIDEGPMDFAHHAMAFVATGTATLLDADSHLPHRPRLVIPLDEDERRFDPRTLRDAGDHLGTTRK
jgi:uncharacterized protein YbjQ (UPF0145 family)